MVTAYLMIQIDLTVAPPEVRSCGFFSEDNPETSSEYRWALIAQRNGRTFEEAVLALRSFVGAGMSYSWLRSLPGYDRGFHKQKEESSVERYEPIWFVICPERGPSEHIHKSEGEAKEEAKRLAQLHQGKAYHVCGSIGAYVSLPSKPTWVSEQEE